MNAENDEIAKRAMPSAAELSAAAKERAKAQHLSDESTRRAKERLYQESLAAKRKSGVVAPNFYRLMDDLDDDLARVLDAHQIESDRALQVQQIRLLRRIADVLEFSGDANSSKRHK
jgi:hypothetical protein